MLTHRNTPKLLQQAGSDELACIEILQAYLWAKIAHGNSRNKLSKKLERVHDRVYRSPSDLAFRGAYRQLTSLLAGARSSWGGKSVVGSLAQLRKPATALGQQAWTSAAGGPKSYARLCARLGFLDSAEANSDDEGDDDETPAARPAGRPAPLFSSGADADANWKPQPRRHEVKWQHSWEHGSAAAPVHPVRYMPVKAEPPKHPFAYEYDAHTFAEPPRYTPSPAIARSKSAHALNERYQDNNGSAPALPLSRGTSVASHYTQQYQGYQQNPRANASEVALSREPSQHSQYHRRQGSNYSQSPVQHRRNPSELSGRNASGYI